MAQFNQVPQVWQRRQAASQRAGPGCAVGAASNSKFLGPTDLDYSELWPSRFAPCFAECLWMTIPELGEALDETSCATAPGRVAVVVWTCFGANRQFAGVTSPHSLSLSLEHLVCHVCLLWFRGPSSATAAAGPLWQVGSNWI